MAELRKEDLWAMADKLRNNMDAAEYKHVCLGLIFLKYISDSFEKAYTEISKDEYADPEDKDEYTAQNVFWVPKGARWEDVRSKAKTAEVGQVIDNAMYAIEKENSILRGVLPKDYGRASLNKDSLGQLVDLLSNVKVGSDKNKDTLGNVYEYFLGKFARAEGKLGGEFYTPRSVVELIVNMIEPHDGRVFDPCCGSGGMFVQSEKFVEDRQGRLDGQLAIYGQESNYNTWKLCRMNLAIRGIDANLGQQNADSFHNDQHKSLKADYIMANPPFNISDWGGERLIDDPRWEKYGIPPTGNANYAWILHMLYHLAPSGTAGFVLANGSLSSSTISEYTIRKNLIKDDKIDCIVTLPGGLFSTTSIPVCLWFITRNKLKNGHRDRHGEILFIDARNMETEALEDSRTQRKLSQKTIDEITSAYHSFRNHELKAEKMDGTEVTYADKQGFWKVATLKEIEEKDYNLTPASYVGIAPIEEDVEPFEAKMDRLTKQLSSITAESKILDDEIKKQLSTIGWKI
ncbi:class I SAM-dependent DNA methyltransferase [Paenibacillus polymyxa]|uniref:type I restriction-modification system subunit M n=1 Tax=Paenibacillus polymyxa TaxID=1406 RepID=UPI002ED0CDCD|nr:class I SAM-dependent DNA methyltransferase [Paenibacillus polymyxa]